MTRLPSNLAILVLWLGAPPAGGAPPYPPQVSAASQAILAAGDRGDPVPSQDSSVKEALKSRDYPWYDPKTDRVRPVLPARWSWQKWLSNRLDNIAKAIGRFFDRFKMKPIRGLGFAGDSLGTLLLIAVLAVFLAALLWLWLREGSRARFRQTDLERLGTAARLAQLPEGIRPGGEDPWAEALKRRAAGDLAGAVVCVFAHQLLALDEDGQIRLVPGRTGRQYVQGLRDPELHELLGGTLGLFEDVYYGHRRPAAHRFELVWSRAEAFRERRGLLGVPR